MANFLGPRAGLAVFLRQTTRPAPLVPEGGPARTGADEPSGAGPTQGLTRANAPRLDSPEPAADNPGMALSLLDQLVQAFGGSRRPAETGTGTGRGTAFEMTSESDEPQVQRLLDALRALGLEPQAFFEVLHSQEEGAPFHAPLAEVYREKLQAMGLPAPAALPAISEPDDLSPHLTDEEQRRRIDERLSEAFQRVMAT